MSGGARPFPPPPSGARLFPHNAVPQVKLLSCEVTSQAVQVKVLWQAFAAADRCDRPQRSGGVRLQKSCNARAHFAFLSTQRRHLGSDIGRGDLTRTRGAGRTADGAGERREVSVMPCGKILPEYLGASEPNHRTMASIL
jgi:hypothetical protein